MKALTKSQAVVVTVMTGTLVMNPVEFRKEIGTRLGREITKEEFTNPDFIKELQDEYRQDFIALCTLVEDSGLILPT